MLIFMLNIPLTNLNIRIFNGEWYSLFFNFSGVHHMIKLISKIVFVSVLALPVIAQAGTASIADLPQYAYAKACLAKLDYTKKRLPKITFKCMTEDDGLCIVIDETVNVEKSPIVKCETQGTASDVIKHDLTVYELSRKKGFVKKEVK
jgi:hypothetical protein